MFDMLKILGWIYLMAFITDMITIAIIAYLFTHAIFVSIIIGVLGIIVNFIKNTLIDKKFI